MHQARKGSSGILIYQHQADGNRGRERRTIGNAKATIKIAVKKWVTAIPRLILIKVEQSSTS